MKTWALGAVAISSLAIVACGSKSVSSGSGGGGSSDTTTVTSSSHATTAVATSASTGTGASDPCADGSDCTACADFATCATCEQGNHPTGANLFNSFIECVLCTACYNVCDGPSNDCPNPPATRDACDVGATSMPGSGTTCGDAHGGCIACSQTAGDGGTGTCTPQLNACQGSSDCIAFNQALSACPQN